MSNPDADYENEAYRCFGPGCTREFETLEEMESIPGKHHRGPRHFCRDCAEEVLNRV